MDLRIGFGLGLYYVILVVVFLGLDGMATVYENINVNASTNVDINISEVTADEVDEGGFFTQGVSFSRFLSWSTFSVFLPDDTPLHFVTLFMWWQGIINLLAIMWVISAIWNG